MPTNPKPINLPVPRQNTQDLSLTLSPGQLLFVVGPNGSGKSSLLHRFFSRNSGASVRITAHRQTWISTRLTDNITRQMEREEAILRQESLNTASRVTDPLGDRRTVMTLAKLTQAENAHNRRIVTQLRREPDSDISLAAGANSPLSKLNSLLRLAQLNIVISILDDDTLVAQHPVGDIHNASLMSDGERNAVLVGIEVISAESNTLFLIRRA